MALGALIAAYQEDDTGGLRALLPLSGRTLIEYQVRCAAAAGAAPIVVMVERIPAALNDAFDRLRGEGVPVLPISDPAEGATRFEPGSSIILIGDGVVPPTELLAQLAEEREPAVATVPDDDLHAGFERIDASSRWAGVALVDGRTLGATVSMLGDWDLQSTLLRRALQDGAMQLPVAPGVGEPLLAEGTDDLADFEKHLFHASVGARDDWASRYVLPPIEQLATRRLLQARFPPEWLVGLALLLTLAAAFCFSRGWLWPAVILMIVSTPLDLIAARLSTLRLRSIRSRSMARRLLWPAAALALLALGWWLSRHGAGWGAFFAAVTAVAFAEAARIERGHVDMPGRQWLFSRRNAVLGGIPFAIFGFWTLYLVAVATYAALSFFYTQHFHHRVERLTTR
ncbi:MAG TPA: hypothetical protein VFK50_07400 [Sphingomicrobium sp.]|nr:hypothetical protein [Sphingomicrobium sp.]